MCVYLCVRVCGSLGEEEGGGRGNHKLRHQVSGCVCVVGVYVGGHAYVCMCVCME